MAPPTSQPQPPSAPQGRDVSRLGATNGAELAVRLDKFWQRVTEGVELSQLWKQFRVDARSSYRLYSHEMRIRLRETL